MVVRHRAIRHAVGFNIKQIAFRSAGIWIRNIIPFTLLALIIQSPLTAYGILAPLDTENEESVYRIVMAFGPQVFGLITAGAVVYGVFQQLRGTPVGLGKALAAGLARLWSVLGVALVVGCLVALGFMLLVVPGILMLCRYYVSIPAAVVEGTKVGESMKRSSFLTEGAKIPIFGLSFLIGLMKAVVVFVVFLVLSPIMSSWLLPTDSPKPPPAPSSERSVSPEDWEARDASNQETFDDYWARLMEAKAAAKRAALRRQSVLGLLIDGVFAALQAVASVMVYYELRRQKEQIDLDKIVAVFD
jgi:hypothetical protein